MIVCRLVEKCRAMTETVSPLSIFWRTTITYLTRKLEIAAGEEARENLRRLIAIHSPMSWAHFNMLGEYDFFDPRFQSEVRHPALIPVRV